MLSLPGILVLGEFQGQKSLVGYSPWGRKESERPEWLVHWHSASGSPGVQSLSASAGCCGRRAFDLWVRYRNVLFRCTFKKGLVAPLRRVWLAGSSNSTTIFKPMPCYSWVCLLSQWLSKVLLVPSPLFNCQWPVSHDQESPSEAFLMQAIFSLKLSISWSAMQHYCSPTQRQFAPFFFLHSRYSPSDYILLLFTSVSEYGSLQTPGIYYTRSSLRKQF